MYSIVPGLPDPFDNLCCDAEKTENKSRCLCENNGFLYFFDSFMDPVAECMDNPVADIARDVGNTGAVKRRGVSLFNFN